MKCLQFVNAFTVITTFTNQILVNVGDGMSVRIDPARIGKDAREPCRHGARERRTDARLNDRVTSNHTATIRRKPRLIQWMRQGFDHPPGLAAEQLCICIERDDKPNALESSAIARTKKSFQLGRRLAHEESIELLELAALSLPADPALLALAPRTPPMEKKEPARSVPAIQFIDPAGDDVDILRVLRHALSRCVGKICQKRESQVCVGISEVANFEALELALDRRGSRE